MSSHTTYILWVYITPTTYTLGRQMYIITTLVDRPTTSSRDKLESILTMLICTVDFDVYDTQNSL